MKLVNIFCKKLMFTMPFNKTIRIYKKSVGLTFADLKIMCCLSIKVSMHCCQINEPIESSFARNFITIVII
ncbi:hypothetical protein NQ317_009570 [Molorchus minor]|uniref:Uncharacterized protein n=1 Tax=Molorchus minor TaxID=1323400 RepID=A0ABQ9IXV8_9CUCU|nr:hypothetical protein NQ317_009570 [Molorchus minor]